MCTGELSRLVCTAGVPLLIAGVSVVVITGVSAVVITVVSAVVITVVSAVVITVVSAVVITGVCVVFIGVVPKRVIALEDIKYLMSESVFSASGGIDTEESDASSEGRPGE